MTDGGFHGVKSRDDWIRAAKRHGYTEYADLQDPTKLNNGFEKEMKYITKTGRRNDAAHGYLHPLLNDGHHPNLHVLCESKVNRVLFDENKKAVAVEYLPNPAYHPVVLPSVKGQRAIVKARRMVVLSGEPNARALTRYKPSC